MYYRNRQETGWVKANVSELSGESRKVQKEPAIGWRSFLTVKSIVRLRKILITVFSKIEVETDKN